MGQVRVEKVQELIKQEISKMLLTEVKDPRIGFVTVTTVEITGDLRQAKVFVSLMGSDEQKTSSWQGLQSCLGYVRSEIGKRVRMRLTPELTWHLDTSLDYSTRIQELLLKINTEEGKE